MAEIGKAYDFLIKQWLPNSNYEAGKGPDFELYPEEFNGPESTLFIYFPVIPKEKTS